MNKLTFNWREELIKLFPDTTERTKGEHDKWCLKCQGIGLVNEGNYVVVCTSCYGKGVIEACECGSQIEVKGYTLCKACRDKKAEEKEKDRYANAQKIPFAEYDGKFLWHDRVIDKDDLQDELYDLISSGDETPRYIYATYKTKVFTNIDLTDIVVDLCEEGYEDMSTYFNYKEPEFMQAQELINRWLKRNEDILDIYYEDYKTIVTLDKIVEEIRAEKGGTD